MLQINVLDFNIFDLSLVPLLNLLIQRTVAALLTWAILQMERLWDKINTAPETKKVQYGKNK